MWWENIVMFILWSDSWSLFFNWIFWSVWTESVRCISDHANCSNLRRFCSYLNRHFKSVNQLCFEFLVHLLPHQEHLFQPTYPSLPLYTILHLFSPLILDWFIPLKGEHLLETPNPFPACHFPRTTRIYACVGNNSGNPSNNVSHSTMAPNKTGPILTQLNANISLLNHLHRLMIGFGGGWHRTPLRTPLTHQKRSPTQRPCINPHTNTLAPILTVSLNFRA